jgi:hypothetical protein
MTSIIEMMLFQAAKFTLRALFKSVDSPELREQAKQKVMDTIPGQRFDEVGWKAIEMIWDTLTCEAQKEIERIGPDGVEADVEGVAKRLAKTYTGVAQYYV